MEQFAQSGADSLVIERMSSELGCSKSSFYWYFKSRSEFLERIVEYWTGIATRQVMGSSSAAEKVEDQITALLVQMFAVTRKGDFLFYLRKLGREHPAFRDQLEAIERTRLQYAKELLTQAGLTAETAEQKAHILYHYYLGWYERHKHEPVGKEELERHIAMLRTQLLGI